MAGGFGGQTEKNNFSFYQGGGGGVNGGAGRNNALSVPRESTGSVSFAGGPANHRDTSVTVAKRNLFQHY